MAESRATGCVRSRSWNRARWLAHVHACSSSGLSVIKYCQREGLNPGSLNRWRRLFRESGEVPPDELCGAEDEAPGPLFVQVESPSFSLAMEPQTFEVVLAGRRCIRVGPGFDEETLRRLVMALESLPC